MSDYKLCYIDEGFAYFTATGKRLEEAITDAQEEIFGLSNYCTDAPCDT